MKRNEAGFTLIEVMVALMIMGLALGALLETIHSAILLRHKSGEGNILPVLAQGKMEAIMAGEERSEEGDFENPWDQYHWRLWREVQGGGVTRWSLCITQRDRNGAELYRLSTSRLEEDKQ